jgi:hypothetical protein
MKLNLHELFTPRIANDETGESDFSFGIHCMGCDFSKSRKEKGWANKKEKFGHGAML